MIDFLITKMHDARFMTMFLAAIAASVTAYTLVMPLFAGEGLAKRMKAVASERERIRQRERDRLAKTEKVSLRQSPKQLVSRVVEDFNLTKWLAQEAARDKHYLYQGIAGRSFERRFQLAENVEVKGAQLENGLLHVDLERLVPEEKKPRRVAINGSESRVIEAKKAA